EETYYTFSYSPVPNDDDVTGGLICANTDDTQRIVGQRQLATLSNVAASTAEARTTRDACRQFALGLSSADRDLPFSLVYLLDEPHGRAQLVASSRIEGGHPAAPAQLSLHDSQIWPLGEALAAQKTLLVELGERFGPLPPGAWDQRPRHAAVVPVAASGAQGVAAVLVVGLNPFRLFDDGYRDFLRLVTNQLGSSLANAEVLERDRRRAEELAELDRAKTAFFSNVSHEFRTPLTLMLGPLEDALREPSGALSGENLETTYRSSLRLLKLVNSLLDFSRIEAGRMRASFEPTDLVALTRDLASAFRAAIERAGLEFRVELAPLAEPVFVDRDMWEKIVLNLLSNAFKYTLSGRVRVALAPKDGGVELSVEDTGTGIPEHELPQIFERFHRVQGSRARTHEGTGIGLALVHELVRLHGGEITASSQLNVGSTFKVWLKSGDEHLPHEPLAEARPLTPTVTGAAPFVQEALRWLPDADRGEPPGVLGQPESLPGPDSIRRDRVTHVLVADDNADMRDYIVRLLRERWRVTAVADGL
ncbi:MAG TPA: GAF domain-containing sensor histidine kinase, partial [Polyangiaceae bacterium]|nr:GAF domain-containing sensor histidine kinase [Polyangiaceae bacterium]